MPGLKPALETSASRRPRRRKSARSSDTPGQEVRRDPLDAAEDGVRDRLLRGGGEVLRWAQGGIEVAVKERNALRRVDIAVLVVNGGKRIEGGLDGVGDGNGGGGKAAGVQGPLQESHAIGGADGASARRVGDQGVPEVKADGPQHRVRSSVAAAEQPGVPKKKPAACADGLWEEPAEHRRGKGGGG